VIGEPAGSDEGRLAFLGLVGLVVLMRGVELAISARNVRRLRRHGGVEAGAAHYPAMVAVHAGMLAAAPLEVILWRRPFLPTSPPRRRCATG
jgi:methyltransferase